MDLKQVKELITLLEKSKLKKISIKEKNGFEISLEKETDYSEISLAAKHAAAMQAMPAHPHVVLSAPDSAKSAEEKKGEDKSKYIHSPMVGTFYRFSGPGQPPFVKVGDKVDKNTIVCIVEAMKVMNEVKAGMAGVVKEICIENSQAVEFGTKLFRIE
ncbi:MAG: acetyl-CoA carboxylase biotin carboxyl carrier protein [Chlamydiales bacterium]|nr:acetyl-CoA carboxylase biotin carboxyl carrier protein [Chlamydiales bacterium]